MTTINNQHAGERITVDVLGKKKLAAKVYPQGVGVLVRALGGEYIIPFEQLMAVQSFREGVKAILEKNEGIADV